MICVDDPGHYDAQPPAGKVLTLVFAMAGRDRATELRFDYHPDPPQVHMWYAVDGTLYQLDPPPAFVWTDMVHMLGADARLEPAPRARWWRRRRFEFPDAPTCGTLPVRFGGVRIEFDIHFFRGPTGEHVIVRKATRLSVETAAEWFCHQWQATRREELQVEFPDLGGSQHPSGPPTEPAPDQPSG